MGDGNSVSVNKLSCNEMSSVEIDRTKYLKEKETLPVT